MLTSQKVKKVSLFSGMSAAASIPASNHSFEEANNEEPAPGTAEVSSRSQTECDDVNHNSNNHKRLAGPGSGMVSLTAVMCAHISTYR